MTIYEDFVAGHEFTKDDRSGGLVRVFRVDGLESNNQIALKALLATDGSKKIPQIGDSHPSIPYFRARQIYEVPPERAKTSMKIAVRYIELRPRLLDVVLNGISVNANTQKNVDGQLMYVGYKRPVNNEITPPSTPYPPPRTDNDYFYCYASAPTLLPEDVLEITYLEASSPHAKNEQYRRKLNSKPWQGGQAREWLCEAILGRIESPVPIFNSDPSNDRVSGKAIFMWIVTYRFRRRPRPPVGPGWDPLNLFVDVNTGRTPNDVDPLKGGYLTGKTKGNGWSVEKLFGEEDFDKLKLVSILER